MSRYRFEIATEADDAELRHVLAGTPMPGRISVVFRREPSYFAAAAVDGRFRQVIAAREVASGRIVGFGSRAISERYVNGRPESIGYLSALRLRPEHRSQGLVARGYAFFRRLHADGRTHLYLTTIAEDNALARRLLTSGRAGLPVYHDAGRYLTAALSLGRRPRHRPVAQNMEIRAARADDLPAVVAFLNQEGPRRQFFPCYREEDFLSAHGALLGLELSDILLALRAGRIVGLLAGWDQSASRQVIVHSYSPLLSYTRPLYNAWARCCGRPLLPPAGSMLRHLIAALPVFADDDPAVFAALLSYLLRRCAGLKWQYLLIGLHEGDPLFQVLRSFRPRWYPTRLYLVCWDNGEELLQSLDGRPPYLELGSL